ATASARLSRNDRIIFRPRMYLRAIQPLSQVSSADTSASRQRHDGGAHGFADALEEAVDDLLRGVADHRLAEPGDAAVGAAMGGEGELGAVRGVGEGDVGGGLRHAQQAAATA